jgi:hypothetical protein
MSTNERRSYRASMAGSAVASGDNCGSVPGQCAATRAVRR